MAAGWIFTAIASTLWMCRPWLAQWSGLQAPDLVFIDKFWRALELPGNEAYNSCKANMHHDYHHGVYYYNYYYQYLQHHLPEECVCYLDNLMSRGHWIGLAWVLTFIAFIMKQNVDLVRAMAHWLFRLVNGGILLSAQGVRCILGGAWKDGVVVWRAAAFFVCEIILIMARRLP
eukprot:1869930-Amphidinium_carterae.2